MVFTLPRELHPLARANKNLIYSLILRVSWLTVKQLACNPKNLGALPGMINVLHTFGSDLKYHIHTHCLVTFGGLSTANKWEYPKRKDKIARYRQINTLYKNIFLVELNKLYRKGDLHCHGNFHELIRSVQSKTWVVHNTKPTLDTSILESYLARYINRVAVSKSRVEYLEQNRVVRLFFNDYTNQNAGQPAPKKSKELDPLSFIHQFCQHIQPPYFHKTRRYGLHASATSKKFKNIIPKAIRSNTQTIRTVMQIIKQLAKEHSFECQSCGSSDFDILLVAPDKEWIYRYISIPTTRPPPKKIYGFIVYI